MAEAKDRLQSPDEKFDDSYVEKQIDGLGDAVTPFEIDPVLDKRVTRKFDRHIIPWLFGIWYAP